MVGGLRYVVIYACQVWSKSDKGLRRCGVKNGPSPLLWPVAWRAGCLLTWLHARSCMSTGVWQFCLIPSCKPWHGDPGHQWEWYSYICVGLLLFKKYTFGSYIPEGFENKIEKKITNRYDTYSVIPRSLMPTNSRGVGQRWSAATTPRFSGRENMSL